MAINYEPSATVDEDDGYSIPKILVAVLLLVLVGAGAYIYFQQRKLTNSVSYLLESKKQAETELNQMIERYNLAIEDNGSLEGDLVGERARIIHYRDSILKLKKEDLSKNLNYKKTIEKLKDKSSIQLDNSPIVIKQPVSSLKSNKSSIEIKKTDDAINNDVATDNPITDSSKIDTTNSLGSVDSVSSSKTSSNSSKKDTGKGKKAVTKMVTNFKRIEVPPTYPGCKGNSDDKKTCFKNKVKRHLSRKFDASILDNLDLKSGQKRIWINFNISKYGKVTNVSARAPSTMSSRAKKKLENEAIRVIKKLPKMIAAKQNGASVEMNYSLPLTFVVQ